MDIERTMEFIVENLASVTARLDRVAEQQEGLAAEHRALAAEQRALAASQRKTDRQMHGLQILVRTGMKILVKVEKNIAELTTAQKELAAAQKRTDQKFVRWLDSLEGSNGHKKRSN